MHCLMMAFDTEICAIQHDIPVYIIGSIKLGMGTVINKLN